MNANGKGDYIEEEEGDDNREERADREDDYDDKEEGKNDWAEGDNDWEGGDDYWEERADGADYVDEEEGDYMLMCRWQWSMMDCRGEYMHVIRVYQGSDY